jgi:hypothetical protein
VRLIVKLSENCDNPERIGLAVNTVLYSSAYVSVEIPSAIKKKKKNQNFPFH